MKKYLVIGFTAIYFITILAPCIDADFFNIPKKDIENFKIEVNNDKIEPYKNNILIFGKVSNVRRGGYTPAY